RPSRRSRVAASSTLAVSITNWPVSATLMGAARVRCAKASNEIERIALAKSLHWQDASATPADRQPDLKNGSLQCIGELSQQSDVGVQIVEALPRTTFLAPQRGPDAGQWPIEELFGRAHHVSSVEAAALVLEPQQPAQRADQLGGVQLYERLQFTLPA